MLMYREFRPLTLPAFRQSRTRYIDFVDVRLLPPSLEPLEDADGDGDDAAERARAEARSKKAKGEKPDARTDGINGVVYNPQLRGYFTSVAWGWGRREGEMPFYTLLTSMY